jgi:hypothetical protein
MRTNVKLFLAVVAGVMSLSALNLYAGVGLLVRFSDDVILENLETGKSYNLRTLGHLPYIVTNSGDKVMDVAIEVQAPPKHKLKPGYEAIPDPSWVKVVPDKFRLNPGEKGISEVIVTNPESAEYVKSNFQLKLWAHTLGENFMAAGAAHYLRISTGKGPETLNAEKKRKAMFSLDFEITPLSSYLVDVQPGVKFDAKKEKGISLKLTNKGDSTIRVKPVSTAYTSAFTMPSGYEPAPDPSWLKFKPGIVKVDGMTIKEIKMYIEIPKEEKHYGKKYAFLVKAELVDTEVPLELYNQVYVTVKGK